jgi:hypothetical protein
MRAPGLGWAIGWILRLAIAGFVMSFLCTSVARLGRDAVVAAYLAIVITLLFAYARSAPVNLREHLVRHRQRGLIAGLAVGALLTINVMAQAASPRPSGFRLVWSLFWLGMIYGILDALLLNVLPVWVVGVGQRPEVGSLPLRLRRAVMALGASLLVTAAYHVGYDEFRGAAVVQPLIGNALLTLGFLVTGSPAAAIIGHVIMHTAAVLHGIESTMQLPPHY